MKSIKTGFVCAVLLAAGTASAGQLVVTPASSAAKSGRVSVALDIVTEGNVSGFNFFVRTGELSEGSVDLSKCVADLPKGFTGHCSQRKDGVGVIGYAVGRETFASGLISVGSLGLPAEFSAKSGALVIEELTFADVDGNAVSSESVVAEQ